MNKVVIIGAGKTGRGFVGRLAAEAGCEIAFVDRDASLVDRLNAQGGFGISFFGGARADLRVEHYRAYTWESAELAGAELIFVSVGGQNLADVGEMLGKKLPRNGIHRVITCENAPSPAQTLSNVLNRDDVFVSEAAVFCTTIENGGLNIASENYPYLPCDADRLGDYAPFIPAVRPVREFGNFLTRKLYTYNAASCVISYLGAVKGLTVYSDAANDPEILTLLNINYAQTNRAMCAEFGYDEKDQAEFAALSRAKFTNAAIRDTVERNARDVERKMAPDERIVGIMRLIQKHGGDASVLEMTAAAALLYTADPKWEARKAEQGFEGILRDYCKIGDDGTVKRILAYAEKLGAGNLMLF